MADIVYKALSIIEHLYAHGKTDKTDKTQKELIIHLMRLTILFTSKECLDQRFTLGVIRWGQKGAG